ncbi:MAG: ankyrin repeat domain-containing protein [Treponema sp.]|nr:ankyrin repeat domain-containing protein [Treponema sp.]
MGEALGKSLLAGLLMIGFLALTGGVALVSGLVALFVHGAAKTVAAWVFGISLGLFSLPFLKSGIDSLNDASARAQKERKYKEERTPLIIAVEKKDIKKINKLIKKGVDVDEVKNHWTALSVAVNLDEYKSSSDYDEIVKILLEAGADPNKIPGSDTGTGLFSRVWRNLPPLGIAVGRHRHDAVRLLIEHGANIDSYTEKEENGEKIYEGNRFMPFQFALWGSYYNSAKLLLESGAKVGTYTYGYESDYERNEKKTLIMELFDGNESESEIEAKAYILEKLLEKIDPNDKDDKGKTALHWAASHYDWGDLRSRLAEMLLNAGADINPQDDNGKTPLMYAVTKISGFEDTLRAVEFLTQHGANISLKDKDGRTALDLHIEKYKNEKLKDERKDYYDKIAALLTPKKISSQKVEKATFESTESIKIASAKVDFTSTKTVLSADFVAGGHTELDDISDDW